MGGIISSICLPINELLLSPLKAVASNSVAFLKEKVAGRAAGEVLLLKDRAEEEVAALKGKAEEEVAALTGKAEEVAAIKDQIEQASLPEGITAGTQEVKDVIEYGPSTSLLEHLKSEQAADVLGKKLSLF